MGGQRGCGEDVSLVQKMLKLSGDLGLDRGAGLYMVPSRPGASNGPDNLAAAPVLGIRARGGCFNFSLNQFTLYIELFFF